MLEIIYGVIDEMSHDLSCDNTNKLIAQLSCMECAIISGCGLPNDNHLLMLSSAIQHCDEQVSDHTPLLLTPPNYVSTL